MSAAAATATAADANYKRHVNKWVEMLITQHEMR